MKRTAEWWSRMSKRERSELVKLEKGQYMGGVSWKIPCSCSICLGCDTAHSKIGGLCPSCTNRLNQLIALADSDKDGE